MNYTIARNIIIYDELDKILSAFNSSRIKTILLAGAALGTTVYDNIGQRPMGDIDLLIKPEDKQSMEESLENLGYSLETSRSDETHYSKTIDSMTFHIDCHTDLSHYLDDRALAGVWSRARPLSVIPAKAGTQQRPRQRIQSLILSPEDTLIYTLADYAVYHTQITPNAINDIKRIIRHYTSEKCHCEDGPAKAGTDEAISSVRNIGIATLPAVARNDSKESDNTINWQLVIQLIKQYRLGTPLSILLDICRQKGIPIPTEVIRSLNPRKRSLEYYLYKTILHPPPQRGETSPLAGDSYDDFTRILRFITRSNARWELFSNSFFPSRHFIRQQYEKTRYPVSGILYPLRFLSLLWRMNKAL